MQKITRDVLIEKAQKFLKENPANRVLGYKKGEFSYDVTPAIFENEDELRKGFIFDDFCGANFSKYLVKETKKEGKILVFLKPCDTYSFNQLLTEHRFDREKVYVVGIACDGMLDINKIKKIVGDGIVSIDTTTDTINIETIFDGIKKIDKNDGLLERCINCKSKKHVAFDEIIGQDGEILENNRFDQVNELENMTSDERFSFWQNELSRCIRCNACRDVCPACTCEKCVFDNPNSGVENKSPANSFEEQMFHIIRAFHVAGRCTDCGECSRVCPQQIPLHLLNRKFIKDINQFYGDYQAGEEVGSRAPLVNYTKDDVEPIDAVNKGGK